jgi:hypothetical protein
VKPLTKGLVLAAIQMSLVIGIAGKLLYERATRPRVWVFCQAYDPDLPIRGRYLSEQLRMPAEGFTYRANANPYSNYYENRVWAYFEVRNNGLVAVPQGSGPGGWVNLQRRGDELQATVEQPVLVFISDTANVQTLHRGEEMWVEVTIPKNGPPRPIQMGIKKDGLITPLKLD